MVPSNICRVWWSTDLWDANVGRSCPLQYLSPLTVGALVGGYREVEAPLSSLLDGPGLVDWHCSMLSSENSSGLYPYGQTEHCLSDSDTVVQSISLIILLLTGYNHSFWFFFSLNFHLVLLIICESANVYMWVCVSVFQSKYCTNCWQERGRQINVLKPTGIWILHTPTHTHTHVTGLNHCTVCGTELFASHKTSAGFSLHLHADTLYNVFEMYSLLIHITRLGKLLQKIRIYFGD